MPVKPPPQFVTRVKKALVEDLKRAGIDATVTTERVGRTKLHRITVLAPRFAKLRFSERQAVVWRIVDQVLSKEDQVFLSMILTLTPGEAAGESAA